MNDPQEMDKIWHQIFFKKKKDLNMQNMIVQFQKWQDIREVLASNRMPSKSKKLQFSFLDQVTIFSKE